MKKNVFVLAILLVVCCSNIAAQTPQLPPGKPSGQPGKVQLPVPAIKPLPPADLVITDLHVVESSYDSKYGWCKLKISVTVKNTGGSDSPPTHVKPLAAKAPGAAWNQMGAYGVLIGLRPNQSSTIELVCTDKQQIVSPRAGYEFMAMVDTDNKVAESNENNNSSAVLHIPAIQQ